MRIGLLLGLLLSSLVARAQRIPVSGRTPASFIPKGYYQLRKGRATGDLNHNGRPDVVLALGPAKEDVFNDETFLPRLLLVLWRTATGSYQLATVARSALLCKGCGGVHGDPFAGVVIRKGVLVVHHYGGSGWRWTIDSKFRYQQRAMRLIGQTDFYGRYDTNCPGIGYPAGTEYQDVNFSTGTYEKVGVSESCELVQHKRGRQPVRPLRRLADYKPVP